MKKRKILSVVGARPNFMKVAPVLLEVAKQPQRFESVLVHTGQHYDEAMSAVFFRDLGIGNPEHNLSVGSGSHAVQTAEIMRRFEGVCQAERPDLVLVAGDVNSTLACSITAAKLLIPVGHIESGLRSFDRTMPEEINRIVTDSISDLLFTTESTGNCNLRREGVPESKIHFVGNTMIDSLVRCFGKLEEGNRPTLETAPSQSYYLATIHRPSNVDEPGQLAKVLGILEAASQSLPVLFVTHPRTRDRLERLNRGDSFSEIEGGKFSELRNGRVHLLPPLSYLDFLDTMSKATAVLTDSGGIQEETTYLGVPCLTLRENTERPVTVELGSNEIVGLDQGRILSSLDSVLKGNWKTPTVPPLWDGKAATRIVDVLSKL